MQFVDYVLKYQALLSSITQWTVAIDWYNNKRHDGRRKCTTCIYDDSEKTQDLIVNQETAPASDRSEYKNAIESGMSWV